MTTVALLAAGVLAGVIGTAGGITSLVAYPALIAAGVAPLAANVTSSVALLGSGASSALRSGPEVAGHGRTLRRRVPPAVVLSAAGAVLLLTTPGHVFDRVVPYLILAGAVVVLLQPVLARVTARRPNGAAVEVAGGAVSVYNGYFGAGSGVLMIAVLLLTTEPDVHRANAVKNVVLLCADVLPAVLFAVAGTVVWSAAWPLGAGALAGGFLGPALARRVPAAALRVFSAACGFVLAGWLLF